MKKKTIVGIITGIMLAIGVCGCEDPSKTTTADATKITMSEDNSNAQEMEDVTASKDSASPTDGTAQDNVTSQDGAAEDNTSAEDNASSEDSKVAEESGALDNNNAAEAAEQAGSIQDEIAGIEAKAVELEKSSLEGATQTELNLTTSDLYMLWDGELNSLWKRITDEEKDMTALLADQRAWIKRKEADVKLTGSDYEGGSMQPQIEASRAKELTRVRVYYLAGYLAKLRGENFTISDEIQKSLDEADPSLNSVFEKFEGQHVFDVNTGHCLRVERAKDSDLKVDGAQWIVSVSMGDTISDLDVSSYSADAIVFHVDHGNRQAWYKLSFDMEYSIQFAYGQSEDNMDDIITCE